MKKLHKMLILSSIFINLFFVSKIACNKSECSSNQCWCVSAGGSTCSVPSNGICDPDECYDRNDCPGNGYWCDGEGNVYFI